MNKSELLSEIYDSLVSTGDINSKDEQEKFNAVIDYLKAEGFIKSANDEDERYSILEDLLHSYNAVTLCDGFNAGFDTAVTLLTKGRL